MYIPDSLELLDVNGDRLSAEQMRATLRENARKLTSHLDIHATMLHLLLRVPDLGEKFGQSLFLPVSADRKCEQAGIPSEYCACHEWFPANASQIDSWALAGSIVAHINTKLVKYQSKCHLLVLDRVTAVSIRDDSVELPASSSERSERHFQLDLLTLPNNAQLHVAVSVQAGEMVGTPTIERHDLYGPQSKCVAGSSVEAFCLCRQLKKN